MTAYNSAAYIKESIQSVLNQDEKNFVFIIVDDASTDATPDIISSFKDQRIRYIRNPKNLHIAAAANVGLRLVNTKYVLRIDSDDICLPNRFSTQLAYMENHPEIDVCGSYIEFFGSKTGVWKMPLTDEAIKARLLWDNVIANSSAMIRMEALKTHQLEYSPLFQYPPFEDYELWLKLLPFAHFHNLNQILVKKREYIESQSELYNKNTFLQLINFHKWMFGLFNISITENEINLFISDKSPGIKPDLQLLENYKSLHLKLLSHFAQTGLFNEGELKKVIERKWKTLGAKIPLTDIQLMNKYLKLSKGFISDNAMSIIKRKLSSNL